MEYHFNYGPENREGRKPYCGRRRRHRARMGACFGIFALAMALRAAVPELSEKLSDGVMGRMDHRSAFAAVGSFVAGDATFGEIVAVLKNGAAEAEPAIRELPPMSGAAQSNLQAMYLQCLAARSETPQAEQPTAAADSIDETLPENVCPEAAELPFEYTRPVPGDCSSAFGYREHPIDGLRKFHYGTDFRGDEGEDIHAFAQGHVAATGISETAGKYLIISHGGGWTTQYFHCSEVYAESGSPVERGEIVAAVGHTGAATGPHLHFELICDGVYHDPGAYLDEQG